MTQWSRQNQTFWYLKRDAASPCRERIETEIAIIGGGVAGLSAAQAFHERGKKVVLFEQYFCGAGASGKSSGFITPNAELSFTDFSKRYSFEDAKTIWKFISSGVHLIKNNCKEFKDRCGFIPQDTIVVATSKKAVNELKQEAENLEKAGFKSAIYTQKELEQHICSKKYYGGIGSFDTFGIDGYSYCQGMKEFLEESGVMIYEETPVTAIKGNVLITPHAEIQADHIIFCVDRFLPQLGFLSQEVYHAQTFLMISQVLTENEIRQIFPNENYLVWDTNFIYNYFRITNQNRLILGGGDIFTTYSQPKYNYQRIQKKLLDYFKSKFPQTDIQFEQFWPGLLGISKDIGPIAGPDRDNKRYYYISAATGLPIAAALGRYSAEHIIDKRNDLDYFFNPYRSFPIGGCLQKVISTKVSFAISNLLKLNIP